MSDLRKAKVFDKIIDPRLGVIIDHEEKEKMKQVMDGVFNRDVPEWLPEDAKNDLIKMAYFITQQTSGFRQVIDKVVGTPQEAVVVKGYIGTNMQLCREFARRFQERHPDLIGDEDDQ